MKKLFALLLALVMVAALCACSGNNPADESQSPAPSQSSQSGEEPTGTPDDQPGTAEKPGTTEPEAYVFVTAKGTVVSVNEDMAEFLTTDGDYLSYFEAESCAFNGLDKTYTYAGFVISTRPEGEKDYINSILLTDDSITTPEGVYIGSTRAAVTAAYGEGDAVGAGLSYTKGDCVLNFIFDGDTVISIEYLPA